MAKSTIGVDRPACLEAAAIQQFNTGHRRLLAESMSASNPAQESPDGTFTTKNSFLSCPSLGGPGSGGLGSVGSVDSGMDLRMDVAWWELMPVK